MARSLFNFIESSLCAWHADLLQRGQDPPHTHSCWSHQDTLFCPQPPGCGQQFLNFYSPGRVTFAGVVRLSAGLRGWPVWWCLRCTLPPYVAATGRLTVIVTLSYRETTGDVRVCRTRGNTDLTVISSVPFADLQPIPLEIHILRIPELDNIYQII